MKERAMKGTKSDLSLDFIGKTFPLYRTVFLGLIGFFLKQHTKEISQKKALHLN